MVAGVSLRFPVFTVVELTREPWCEPWRLTGFVHWALGGPRYDDTVEGGLEVQGSGSLGTLVPTASSRPGSESSRWENTSLSQDSEL